MNTCIIGIGSNIDAEKNIPQAIRILTHDVHVLQTSTMLKTKPIGFTDQHDFTNGAVKIETKWSLKKLNKYLKKVEDQLGRDRSQIKFGPRTIDLDIMVWNDEIVDQDYYTRDFLRQSAAELGFHAKNQEH
ncbi:2-amino-4-hydroxy-6-hydroxymethyldihydropteridine diphosphokinase [Sunxiuqinia elliptica]|uniref:2-amino-4-hydroxy-6-hydroxymethyldihydropteridine pyrophosphokinase n=1 Tax=Sunxiuqinia elliptica TaxID=655355 RepID=A0A4R6H053_9BACT|nr:2-amino-4-hydroxy-6-hydroxymethyldihydropteridine diphosphokinase [Sunxiuqinia elliptica]TDO01154.1 2-amino-4-hydroxy-6-hydroxymethyldihydropteridine diphosphokinase [Sunxiuqinia elliptica]TDO57665.1 2-amino-4-hydroxy-6-hydroxymethyldihydropteridine diphosphokinase [Sunxiuqinia elliptica]